MVCCYLMFSLVDQRPSSQESGVLVSTMPKLWMHGWDACIPRDCQIPTRQIMIKSGRRHTYSTDVRVVSLLSAGDVRYIVTLGFVSGLNASTWTHKLNTCRDDDHVCQRRNAIVNVSVD